MYVVVWSYREKRVIRTAYGCKARSAHKSVRITLRQKVHGLLVWLAVYVYSGRTVLAYPESSGGLWPNIHGVETLRDTVLKSSVHSL